MGKTKEKLNRNKLFIRAEEIQRLQYISKAGDMVTIELICDDAARKPKKRPTIGFKRT